MTSNGVDKSRLVLGTAALGMPYGVSNTLQPSREKALEILDAALACGINTFDTGSAYGMAEEILGHWLASERTAYIISKMKPYDSARGSAFVITELEESLRRLRLDVLDGYLVHAAGDIRLREVFEGLRVAKERGLVRNIGASVYDEAEAESVLGRGIDYIQVPYNAFDQRFGRSDFLGKALERKVIVFARSPFLQGLLLMDPPELPAHMENARPHLERYIALAERHGLSRVEVALGFVLAGERIPHIVVGAVSAAQVRELASARALSDEVVSEIRELFKNVPHDVTDPRLWTTIA